MRYWLLIVYAWLVAAAAPCQAATAEVVFVIDMRDVIRAGQFDAAHDTVGVRGGTSPLTWSKSLLATPIAGQPGRYRAQLHMDVSGEAGQGVQYKFKVESPAQPDEGWEPARNRVFAAVTGQVMVERAFGSDPGLPPPQRTGHIERLGRPASAFVSPREVQVWLSPSYEAEPLRRFPVLYLHDGQNVFDNQAAGAEWQVDEAAQKLVLSNAVQPMIIVAVASNGQRTLDYTPWLDVVEGRREGGEMLAGARALRDVLQAKGWPMHYLEAQSADHSEAAWAARVEDMLKFLYSSAQPGKARP